MQMWSKKPKVRPRSAEIHQSLQNKCIVLSVSWDAWLISQVDLRQDKWDSRFCSRLEENKKALKTLIVVKKINVLDFQEKINHFLMSLENGFDASKTQNLETLLIEK